MRFGLIVHCNHFNFHPKNASLVSQVSQKKELVLISITSPKSSSLPSACGESAKRTVFESYISSFANLVRVKLCRPT